MTLQPRSLNDYIAEIRQGLVCGRCGKYIGSLALRRYLPPPYPVALDRIAADQEVEALVGFEWHMLDRMRRGNFTIMHPELDGRCVTVREWVEAGYDDEDEEDAGDEGEEAE
jgi:hypothetical protein